MDFSFLLWVWGLVDRQILVHALFGMKISSLFWVWVWAARLILLLHARFGMKISSLVWVWVWIGPLMLLAARFGLLLHSSSLVWVWELVAPQDLARLKRDFFS